MARTRLKQLIEDRGISQKVLAQESDVAEYRISLLCNGKSSNIQLITAKKICEFLNCSLDDAFGDILDTSLYH
jgi:DNA-binding Xre family transcriptional regulator